MIIACVNKINFHFLFDFFSLFFVLKLKGKFVVKLLFTKKMKAKMLFIKATYGLVVKQNKIRFFRFL